MPYYAHSGTLEDRSDWQTLPDHLSEVARLASEFGEPLGLKGPAGSAGLFHDLGKYDPDFQRRLSGENIRVDHSTAGTAVLMAITQGADRGIAELVGYAILGHHAGLPDKHNEFGHCFKRRVEEFKDKLDPVWRTELSYDPGDLQPTELMRKLSPEKRIAEFELSVVARMLFSCLVDAEAWIETLAPYSRPPLIRSPLARRRGSKRVLNVIASTYSASPLTLRRGSVVSQFEI